MGIARLLAKGWATVCIFAGAHALARALAGGASFAQAIPANAIDAANVATQNHIRHSPPPFDQPATHKLGHFRNT